MTFLRSLFRDKILVTGWCFIAVSFTLFCLTMNASPDGLAGGTFLLHYVLAVIFLIIPRLMRNSREEGNRIHYHAIKLVLFLISAYALNRNMSLFANSPTWLCVLLVAVCVNCISTVFFPKLPPALRYVQMFLHGVSIVLFIYLAIYLVPIYAVSVIALLAIGLSVHTFIPLIFSIYTVRLVSFTAGKHRKWWISFFAGIATPLVIIICYTIAWSSSVRELNRAYYAAIVSHDSQLPLWMQLAQHSSNNGMTERVLKSDLLFTGSGWDNLFWNVPTRNFGDEKRMHDPLVIIASSLSGKVQLSEEDRIKVLESGYKARHQALRRLWTGADLSTTHVSTELKVRPDLHLAYTEKFITVSNNSSSYHWPRTEEAIYTFHLPEGAVITALSLWINGQEEKGILTSKGKAEEAYNNIVGYERRDPSVVHWQEGNTVTVRVFPVTAGGSRTFKIGITAPLRQAEGQLAYDNSWFEGPDAGDAEETVKVEMVNAPRTFMHTTAYRTADAKTFTTTRSYQPVWSLDFTDLGLQPNSFFFDGARYSIVPYQKQRVPAAITDVYLDINRAWKANDLEAVLDAVKGRRVWIFNGTEMKRLTDDNRESLLAPLRDLQFSIFPFQLITDRAHSLVISESGAYTPNIGDLQGTHFLKELSSAAGGDRIRLFHIGADPSPYLRSLNEFRLFDFEWGRPDLLRNLLAKGEFVHDEEPESSVIVHTAGVSIVKTPGVGQSNAPDHLMRLFAYNHIMKGIGSAALTHDREDSTLVEEAQKAYVVSPVSSLIVLESQKDYDEYGIKDAANSLKNASQNSKGAVPEPGEWAIIILSVVAFGYFLIKWRLQ